MKRAVSILASIFIATCSSTAQTRKNEPLTFPPVVDASREGSEIAERLRTAVPNESAEFAGTLKIRRGQVIQNVLIVSRLIAGTTNWQMIYEARPTHESPAERLVVIHAPGQPNVYVYQRGSNELTQVSGNKAAVPFAGSDFWLSDLGLEFLHWPHQRLLKRETRKSRACQVLESRPGDGPKVSGYARVVSWIDAEADGVLIAEAYDANGKLLKEFEVDRFTKVRGRWQLKLMWMRSLRPSSRTVIEFDFDEK